MAVSSILAAFILIAASCAPRPAADYDGPLPTEAELLAGLEVALKEFASLKGLARIVYRGNGDRIA